MTILTTAFQIGGFQFNAFQEAQTVGSGGWIPFWWRMLHELERERKRRAAEAKRKKKKKAQEQEEEQDVPETVALRFVLPQSLRANVDLTKYLRAIVREPVIDEAKELQEFYELMEMVAKMEDFA